MQGRRALLVGSSLELERRAERLISIGCRLRVLTRVRLEVTRREALQALGKDSLELVERDFVEADLDDCWLAVLSDADGKLAQRMAAGAELQRVLFCAIDQPEWSNFSHVAIAKAGEVQIGISTSGLVPGLAAQLGRELRALIGRASLGSFAARLARLRRALPKAKRRIELDVLLEQVRIDGELQLPREGLERRLIAAGLSTDEP
jgi:siroheme synthase-like protein